ncbi:hypothetical protein INR49_020110 [Caranx melampygus]|nr:hypothetical protein INR49_020110 [Caranx melampygus]
MWCPGPPGFIFFLLVLSVSVQSVQSSQRSSVLLKLLLGLLLHNLEGVAPSLLRLLLDLRLQLSLPQLLCFTFCHCDSVLPVFISQFDQFGLAAAVRRVFHLQTLPLLLGQTFVIRHLPNDSSHSRSKLCLELFRSGVCVLHCVVKQSRLQVCARYFYLPMG